MIKNAAQKNARKWQFSPLSFVTQHLSWSTRRWKTTTTKKMPSFLSALLRRIAYSPRTVTLPLAPQKPPMLDHSLSIKEKKNNNTINHKLVCTPPLNPSKPNAIPTHITTQQQGSPHTRKKLWPPLLHTAAEWLLRSASSVSLESCPTCTCSVGKTICRVPRSLPYCR